MGFWQRIAINSLVFIALAYFMQGFLVSSVWTALGASIVLAFLNFLVILLMKKANVCDVKTEFFVNFLTTKYTKLTIVKLEYTSETFELCS